MRTIGRTGLKLLFSFFFAFLILNFMESSAKATTVTDSYYFVMNGTNYTPSSTTASEAELKTEDTFLYVTSTGIWDTGITVTWISSETGVVTLEDTSYGSNYKKVVRQGPGYSTITAIIKNGANTRTISFVIKVSLAVDLALTETVKATTTGNRVMVLDTVGQSKQIYLKYVDYTSVTGSAISGSAISTSAVSFESDNLGVATIDSSGKVTAIGSGSATITITSDTMSAADKNLAVTLTIVVCT